VNEPVQHSIARSQINLSPEEQLPELARDCAAIQTSKVE
jgi:hypothetical protein